MEPLSEGESTSGTLPEHWLWGDINTKKSNTDSHTHISGGVVLSIIGQKCVATSIAKIEHIKPRMSLGHSWNVRMLLSKSLEGLQS